MVFTLIQQGLGLRPREKRALCGKMHFGEDPNYDPDAGSELRPLTLEALTIFIKKHEVQRVFFNLKSS